MLFFAASSAVVAASTAASASASASASTAPKKRAKLDISSAQSSVAKPGLRLDLTSTGRGCQFDDRHFQSGDNFGKCDGPNGT